MAIATLAMFWRQRSSGGRFSIRFAEPVTDALYMVKMLLLVMAYDWWSTGRVQSVTLWAGAFVVIAQQARYLIGHTTFWQKFAGWVQIQTSPFR
jgi:hypothetical protein